MSNVSGNYQQVTEEMPYQMITKYNESLYLDNYGVVQSSWERQMNKMLTE